MLAAFAAVGCDLTGPTKRDVYTLVRVNDQPLPFIASHGRILGTGRIVEELRVDGTITVFNGGRFLWEGTVIYQFDGVQVPGFGPVHNHLVSDYTRTDSTMLVGQRIFDVRIAQGGRVLLVTDLTGTLDWAVYEFVRP